MPLVSFSSLPCGPGCCDMIWSRHVKKAKPIFVICLTLRSSTLYSPPSISFVTLSLDTHRFLSLHTSPPFPAVTLNFSSRSRLTPHQNSARRLKMYPSGIHRIPLSFPKPRLEPETCAWASVIGRIGVLTPPPSLYPATANSLRDMSNDTISSDLIALRSLCTKEAG